MIQGENCGSRAVSVKGVAMAPTMINVLVVGGLKDGMALVVLLELLCQSSNQR